MSDNGLTDPVKETKPVELEIIQGSTSSELYAKLVKVPFGMPVAWVDSYTDPATNVKHIAIAFVSPKQA